MSEYTQGELKIGANDGKVAVKTDDFVICEMIMQAGEYGKYVTAANAKELVKRWNAHNVLLDALKGLLSSYKADFETIAGAPLNNTESVLKALAAIKSAEQ